MREIKSLTLREHERRAIEELKTKLKNRFPEVEIILYGSKVRGDDVEESDIDILILLSERITTALEEEIFNIAYDIELKYNICFGIIVNEKEFWNSELAKAMPFHWSVEKEGIII